MRIAEMRHSGGDIAGLAAKGHVHILRVIGEVNTYVVSAKAK